MSLPRPALWAKACWTCRLWAIFLPPPMPSWYFDAMKLADKGHGVLLLTLNYAGDQLAGKQASKLAQKAGLNFRQVVTGEEIQFDPNGEDNKRGLAGAVALYHAAASGYP